MFVNGFNYDLVYVRILVIMRLAGVTAEEHFRDHRSCPHVALSNYNKSAHSGLGI